MNWLQITKGDAPLLVTFPHTGTDIPPEIESALISGWLARKDTDWWVHQLYDFAVGIGATTIRTCVSRSVIDVNRDPSGASLYPGQATTDLCPLTTFDGEPLYRDGLLPDGHEIARRRTQFFDPYHAAVADEIARLLRSYERVVLYDAHSIRSQVPRLFSGELPHCNIGTNDGAACDRALTAAIEAVCDRSTFSRVTNGRFKGGWTTRHYGQPARHVHAVQMELACRSYLHEPADSLNAANWPSAYDPSAAAPLRAVLAQILHTCVGFADARRSA